jgi:sugar phosphate permease
MVALAEDRWWSARDRGRWLRAAAWTHVVLGAALTGVTLILFSSYFVCPNPGVCRDVFEPYPPLAIPSVIVLVAGICGVAIDRLDRGGGTPEGFPGSARP